MNGVCKRLDQISQFSVLTERESESIPMEYISLLQRLCLKSILDISENRTRQLLIYGNPELADS